VYSTEVPSEVVLLPLLEATHLSAAMVQRLHMTGVGESPPRAAILLTLTGGSLGYSGDKPKCVRCTKSNSRYAQYLLTNRIMPLFVPCSRSSTQPARPFVPLHHRSAESTSRAKSDLCPFFLLVQCSFDIELQGSYCGESHAVRCAGGLEL
jgi:hypothetical protein